MKKLILTAALSLIATVSMARHGDGGYGSVSYQNAQESYKTCVTGVEYSGLYLQGNPIHVFGDAANAVCSDLDGNFIGGRILGSSKTNGKVMVLRGGSWVTERGGNMIVSLECRYAQVQCR